MEANRVIAHRGRVPKLGRDVWIAPGAVVAGDIEIGDRASIWFGCVLRGDDNAIRIGAGTNIQDGSIIHIVDGRWPTIVGAGVTVGHGAILHGCTIEDEAMIGIGAIVLDGARVGRGAVVAAGAMVPPGKIVGPGEMWAGVPAKLQRPVKEQETDFIRRNVEHYHQLAMSYAKG